MPKVPYVHSSFPRIENDNYQTIDPRCIYGFLQHFHPTGLCLDVCAPSGSGIVSTLRECGYNADCIPDAFANNLSAEWIITNPPYTRKLVDEIILRQIKRVEDDEVKNLAVLVRSNFDFARGRISMFDNLDYAGQIKLCFRPWWSEDRKAQPIHNFVWHIWKKYDWEGPHVFYSDGHKP